MKRALSNCITFLVAILVAPALLSAGETAYWTNTVSTTAPWFTASNWTNQNGVLEFAPATGEDIVLTPLADIPAGGTGAQIADQAIWSGQRIYTPVSHDNTVSDEERNRQLTNAIIGKITGDSRHTISIDNRTSYGQYGVKNNDKIKAPDGGVGRYLQVSDPSDFYGIWHPYGVWSRLIVNPKDTSKVATLHNLVTKQIPVLSVASGSTAEVEVMTGGVALRKYGAGTASIGQTALERTKLVIEDGVVELKGRAAGEVEAILAKAAVHLDATKGTFETGTDSESKTVVWRWNDCDGRSVYAHANTNRSLTSSHQLVVLPPRYVAGATANGLPLVDFDYKGRNPGKGKPCPVLEFSQRYTNVREVFYVADCPHGATAFVLGDYANSGISLQFTPGGNANNLYDKEYSDPRIRHADIFLNGKPTAFDACGAQLLDLHTVAQNTCCDARVFLLASREFYGESSGGVRLGEVLLFTNDLTRVERIRLSNYLNRKWGTAAVDDGCDLSEIYVSDAKSGGAHVSVPAGRTAAVGTVHALKGLYKDGAGALEISNGIYMKNPTITVNGGTIGIRKPTIADDTRPADGAYVWLDATKGTELLVENGTNYVTKWNDCRGAGTYAVTNKYGTGVHRPRLVDSPITGTKVLDFGTANGNVNTFDKYNCAGMYLSNWNSGSKSPTYHYFAVMRMKSVRNSGVSIIAGSDMACYHDGASIFSTNYRTTAALGSMLFLNGEPIDTADATLYNDEPATTNQFYLVSLAASAPFPINALCSQRSGCEKQCGGMEFAEVITYITPLTPAEHIQTEAYLLKKWFNKTHPSQQALAPNYIFNNGTTVQLDADCDMTLDSVQANSTDLVKKGTGLVTVSSFTAEPKTISVEGGGLSVTLQPAAGTFFDEALYRIDASRLDTMTYSVSDGVTNVSAIADFRLNGWKATAVSDDLATTEPKLVAVEAKPGSGIVISALDFGGYSWRTNGYIKLADTPSAAMKFSSDVSAKHAITVFADAHGAHQQSVLSGYGNTGTRESGHRFQRNWKTGQLYWGSSTWGGMDIAGLKASSIVRSSAAGTRLDGQSVNNDTKIGEGFHIYDFIADQSRTTKTQTWTESLTALAMTYGCQKANDGENWGYDYDIEWEDRGGQYVAEQLAFSRMLTTDEQSYLNRYLQAKWFGGEQADSLVTNVLDDVSVAAGAELLVDFGVSDVVLLNVKNLGGAGTFSVANLTVSEALDVTLANGRTDCLAIDGRVSLKGSIALNVSVDKTAGKLKAGRYPILTAKSLTVADGTSFAINVTTAKSGVYAEEAYVTQEGGTLYLNVVKHGLLLMVN